MEALRAIFILALKGIARLFVGAPQL